MQVLRELLRCIAALDASQDTRRVAAILLERDAIGAQDVHDADRIPLIEQVVDFIEQLAQIDAPPLRRRGEWVSQRTEERMATPAYGEEPGARCRQRAAARRWVIGEAVEPGGGGAFVEPSAAIAEVVTEIEEDVRDRVSHLAR